MNPAYQQIVVQADCGSVMPWDVFYWKSQSPLVKLESILIGLTYTGLVTPLYIMLW